MTRDEAISILEQADDEIDFLNEELESAEPDDDVDWIYESLENWHEIRDETLDALRNVYDD